MEVFVVSLLNGLVYGMLLFMLASGLTLIFSMMGVLNFAHGVFLTVSVADLLSQGAEAVSLFRALSRCSPRRARPATSRSARATSPAAASATGG